MKSKIFVGFLFLVVGCNSYSPKDQGSDTSLNAASPDFSMIQTKIIQPYCIMCHSSAGGNAGGINLENYTSVMHNIDKVQDTVAIHQTMPPGAPISKSLQALLVTWISNGSHEQVSTPAQGPSTPPSTPPGPAEPLTNNFNSISKNILTPKCLMCHGADGATPVTDYNFLIKSQWVTPNDLSKSALYLAIKVSTNGAQMPPSQPLSQNEIDTIASWITAGAKNN